MAAPGGEWEQRGKRVEGLGRVVQSFTGDVGVNWPERAIDDVTVEAVDSFEGFVGFGG